MRKTQKPPLKLVGATTTSTAANPFQPPPNLGTSGASAWTSIQNEYQISDAGGLELLNQLCAALDDITSYDEIISHDGIVIRTKTGTRAQVSTGLVILTASSSHFDPYLPWPLEVIWL